MGTDRNDHLPADHLFAYGTLMCGDIMFAVAGSLPRAVTGTLYGYCRRKITNESYPAIINAENSSVEGVVYLNIPEIAWLRLDRFEGEMYDRVKVEVVSAQKEPLQVFTYVLNGNFHHTIEESGWDFQEFLESQKRLFLEGYVGFAGLND